MNSALLLHTMSTPELTLLEAVALAPQLGATGVEVVVDSSYSCGLPTTATPATLDQLTRAAADSGTRIAALSPYVQDFDHESELVRRRGTDELRRVVDQADAVGAASVRVLAGRDERTTGAADSHDRCARAAESIRAACDAAAAAGVTLNIENHMGTLARSAAATARIVRAVGHPAAGIIYDPANLLIMDGEVPDRAVAEQGAWIRALHLKDFRPKANAEGREPRLPGSGDVDWDAALAALQHWNVDVPVTFEYERRWFPGLAVVAVAFPIAQKYLTERLAAIAGAAPLEESAS
jgi:L-ribulose-5-phosphate 3-epimerase